MENKCNIVMDLLPLYVEDMLSEDSIKFVDEHLAKCSKCHEELRELESSLKTEENLETKPLSFLKEELDKDKKSFGLIIALAIISLSIIIFSFITTPRYIEYSKELLDMTYNAEEIVISFNEPIGGYQVSDYGISPDTGSRDYFITAWSTHLSDLLGYNKEETINIPRDEKTTVFYDESKGNTAIPIFGSISGGVALLPRLALNYYIQMALISLGILGIILLFLKKFSRKFSISIYLYILGLPLSYLLAALSIKGFNSTTHHMARDFFFICILSVAYYLLFVVIGLILNRRNKRKILSS